MNQAINVMLVWTLPGTRSIDAPPTPPAMSAELGSFDDGRSAIQILGLHLIRTFVYRKQAQNLLLTFLSHTYTAEMRLIMLIIRPSPLFMLPCPHQSTSVAFISFESCRAQRPGVVVIFDNNLTC